MYNICCPCVTSKSQSKFFNSFVYTMSVGLLTTNVTGKTETRISLLYCMSHSHQTPKILSYVLNNFPAVFTTIPIITVKWSINLC